MILLYNLRTVERLLGSRKYLSLVIVLFALSVLTVPLVLLFAYSIFGISPVMRASQSAVVIGLISLYHSLVPVVYKFRVSPSSPNEDSSNGRPFNTLTFSDKDFLYFFAFQLALFFSGGLLYSTVGWVTCKLVYAEILPGKNWRVPFYEKLGLESIATSSYLAHAGYVELPVTAGNGRAASDADNNNTDTENGGNTSGETEVDTTSHSDNGEGSSRRPLASQLLDTFRT